MGKFHRRGMVSGSSAVAAALACVLITCAVDLDLDHTEHHSKTIELGTPQARTDSTLPAEFSGPAKESATDAAEPYAMKRTGSEEVQAAMSNSLPTSGAQLSDSEALADETSKGDSAPEELGQSVGESAGTEYGGRRRRSRGFVKAF